MVVTKPPNEGGSRRGVSHLAELWILHETAPQDLLHEISFPGTGHGGQCFAVRNALGPSVYKTLAPYVKKP